MLFHVTSEEVRIQSSKTFSGISKFITSCPPAWSDNYDMHSLFIMSVFFYDVNIILIMCPNTLLTRLLRKTVPDDLDNVNTMDELLIDWMKDEKKSNELLIDSLLEKIVSYRTVL